ncbi:unnamed protein product [Diamesa serratosioi]
MDFSQHTKINNGYGMTPGKRPDCEFNNNFNPPSSQKSNRFSNINNPNYQQQYELHQQQLQQQQQYHEQQQQHQQQHQQQQSLELNDNGKYIQKMVKIYEPHVFGGEPDQYCQPKVNFYDDYNHHQHQHQQNIDQESESQMNYYQCTPSTSQYNPFKPMIDSTRIFTVPTVNSEQKFASSTCQYSHDQEFNNQTIMYNHDCNKNYSNSEFQNNKKLYKSQTKILNIPNGVRIITEILRTENNSKTNQADEGGNGDENIKECQTNDNWIEQYIETELTPSSEILKKFSETVEN